MARKKEPEIKKHKAVSSSSFITSIRREEETKKKKAKRTLIITVCAILLAGLLLAGWALLSSSDYFCEHSAAVRVKNHSVSPVMFDYFYRDAYSTFCQQNLDVISLYLDTTKPLDEQWYDQQQNVTWADYFMNLAESSIQRTYCLYDEAMAEGYAATAEDDKAVESAVSKLEAQAKDKDSDLASYLVSYYGRGCTEKTFREYSRIARIAAQVQTQYEQGLSYSSDELSTYYSSHRSAFDAVNYRIYPVAVKNDAGTVDMDASEKLAESIAEESRGDEAKYLSLIEADAGPDSAYATGDYSRRDNYTYTYVPENLADWLFDTGRREGDTTAVQNGENGWFAVYYLSLNTHDYTTADLRVVEVADYYKDADKAYKAAQKLLETFESGDRTESSFAALADENGAEDGGFMQNTALGELDDAAEAWAFDAARQPGDAVAVKGENSASSYLVYYVGPGMNCRDWFVEKALREAAVEDWVDGLLGGSTLKEAKFGMQYVTTK